MADVNQTLKRQMLDNYLKQQNSVANPTPTPSVISEQVRNSDTLVPYSAATIPESISLEEFKNYVKKWLEFDNFIKKAKGVIKEKQKQRDELSKVITKFMCKYNIEDLNTKEGRIRCKTSVVKAPVSQKVVKQKISDYFKDNDEKRVDILTKIYEEREPMEKVSLRRLKIT